MRSKEVDQAIELLEKIKISESMNVYIGVKDVKKTKNLLKYIEELEKENNKCEYYESVADALYKDSISKDKIRDKIKELEENNYVECIEFNLEVIEILKSLLGE